MKILAVYPGRFQPFHKGHAQVYQWLKNKFDDVVIATSDKVEAPKSPFNFAEKKRMMVLAGVPSGDIKQVTNPYIAREVLKDYNPKDTILVFAVSQKDMEEDPRFDFSPTKSGKARYLQPYKGNEKKLKPFGDNQAPKGYVVVTPTFTFDVLGKPATSASELRKQFVKLNPEKQKAFITDLFGKYSASIHKLMDKKIGDMLGKPKTIKKLKEDLNESIDRKNFGDMLDSFVKFASDHLGLQDVPDIRHKTDDDDYKSFAAYNPSENEMSIYTKNRHPMDIFRSIAHELVHHKQNKDERLNNVEEDGKTGSDIENEANALAGVIMRNFGQTYPENFKLSYVKEETQITEGINDPGKLKAIFLAGGPGSGKDYVMNSVLNGEGLKEINSDTAFEYLMKKNKLDMEMPDSERVERDIVRGRAKSMTKEKERLALAGRLGLIINGTADDLDKIKSIKKNLESDGYETMMVFVNTSDEVSKQRNVDRGKMGGRKVPDGTDKQGVPDGTDDIRSDKWIQAQKNLGELQKIFGNQHFAVIDNSVDVRKVSPEEKTRVQTNFNRVRRMAQQFVRADNQNPAAKKWIEAEQQKRNIQYQQPKAQKTLTQVRSEVPKVAHKPDNELMTQARRLGLSYYGFGRFGRKVNGTNTVLYTSKGNQLVKIQPMKEEKDPCWKGYKMVGMKKKGAKEVPNCVPVSETISMDDKFDSYLANSHVRDQGTTSLRKLYASMTPGQDTEIKPVTYVYEEKRKIKFVKKKITKEDNNLPRSGLPVSGGIGPETTQYRPFTVTGFTGNIAGSMSESIIEWANSEATQKKFVEKYGSLAEQKLNDAALRLEQCGCGSKVGFSKKSVAKIKEAKGVSDMGTVASTGKEEINERGADSKGLYRSTESGAGLTRKGAKKFGIKTAVTTPPSKLDPEGKAAGRRKSFCARMGGMKGPMKDEKGRPTRKAMSLRRWNCEE
jgi:cytidyltransferase-like protein